MSNLPPSFALDSVREYRLHNGLTIITLPDHTLPIVTCMICYGVGSRNDPEGCAGMSHFLEHMLFKGTSRFGKGEIDYLTTLNGGVNNAFTSLDYTVYYFSFASDRWTTALKIEADRMRNNLFEEVELDLERHVILEELKMEMDNPWGALRQIVETEAYKGHPYGHPVIGFPEDVERISVDEMVSFYHRYYVPNNAILVLVGDFDRDSAASQIELLFGAVSAAQLPVRQEASALVQAGGWFDVTHDSQVSRTVAAGPAPAFDEDSLFPFLVLEKLLTQGELSRLNTRLVEREGLVSMVHSEISETRDPYLFLLQAELVEGASPGHVRNCILEEFEQLASNEVSGKELVRARNQCVHDFIADQEIGIDQAIQLGLARLLSNLGRLAEFPERLAEVTAADVVDAAACYLRPERYIFAATSV